MTEPETLRRELAAALRDEETPRDGHHPDPGELIAYSCGELSEDAEAEVAEHLTRCRACLDLVLDLDGFLEHERAAVPAPDEIGPVDLRTARAWRELQTRLDESAPPSHRVTGGQRFRIALVAVAASLLLAAGFAVWAIVQQRNVDSLRQENARLDMPQPDAPIVDLFPSTSVRSTYEAESPQIPEGPGYVILILNLPGDVDHERFEAELLDMRGEALWTGGLEISEFGTLRLGLPRHWLGDGDRQLRVFGVGTDRQLLATFDLDVADSSEGGR